jgi:hypothetical protein
VGSSGEQPLNHGKLIFLKKNKKRVNPKKWVLNWFFEATIPIRVNVQKVRFPIALAVHPSPLVFKLLQLQMTFLED